MTGLWFSPISSINKTDHHDITEILLKVALNTINLINQLNKIFSYLPLHSLIPSTFIPCLPNSLSLSLSLNKILDYLPLHILFSSTIIPVYQILRLAPPDHHLSLSLFLFEQNIRLSPFTYSAFLNIYLFTKFFVFLLQITSHGIFPLQPLQIT